MTQRAQPETNPRNVHPLLLTDPRNPRLSADTPPPYPCHQVPVSVRTLPGQGINLMAEVFNETSTSHYYTYSVRWLLHSCIHFVHSFIHSSIQGPFAVSLTSACPPRRAPTPTQGSLTTPPCTQGLYWHVMLEPIPISQAQVRAPVRAPAFERAYRVSRPANKWRLAERPCVRRAARRGARGRYLASAEA